LKFHNKYFIRSPRVLKNYRKRILESDITEVKDQIKEKLIYLIEHPSEMRKMGDNSKKLIEKGKFSIQSQKQQLAYIYDAAINS